VSRSDDALRALDSETRATLIEACDHAAELYEAIARHGRTCYERGDRTLLGHPPAEADVLADERTAERLRRMAERLREAERAEKR
jgi:hypothetical protein